MSGYGFAPHDFISNPFKVAKLPLLCLVLENVDNFGCICLWGCFIPVSVSDTEFVLPDLTAFAILRDLIQRGMDGKNK